MMQQDTTKQVSGIGQTVYYSPNKDENRSMMVGLLEQQLKTLEQERDLLCQQKAELMLQVHEYQAMVDEMAIKIKDNDKENRNEHMEMDEYVSRLE